MADDDPLDRSIILARDAELRRAHRDAHDGFVVFELTRNAIPPRFSLSPHREPANALVPPKHGVSSETWYRVHPDQPEPAGWEWVGGTPLESSPPTSQRAGL
jgi:hypothetical protein